MLQLLAHIYTQTDYQAGYRSLAKLVPSTRLQYINDRAKTTEQIKIKSSKN